MASLDWTAVQQALVTWVRGATGLGQAKVLWQGQDFGEPELPYMVLGIEGGPRTMGRPDLVLAPQIMVETITVSAAADQIYTISIDDVAYAYDASAGQTITQIRNALLALLAGLANLTAASLGTNRITITGSLTRPHFHTAVLPAGSISTASTTTALLQHAANQGRLTVRLEACTASVKPADHARALVDQAVASLRLPTVAAALRAATISFGQVLGEQDLTDIVETKNRSRYVADLELNCLSDITEQVEWVRSVTIEDNVVGA